MSCFPLLNFSFFIAYKKLFIRAYAHCSGLFTVGRTLSGFVLYAPIPRLKTSANIGNDARCVFLSSSSLYSSTLLRIPSAIASLKSSSHARALSSIFAFNSLITLFIFAIPKTPTVPHFICATNPATFETFGDSSARCAPSLKCRALHASRSRIQSNTAGASSPSNARPHNL